MSSIAEINAAARKAGLTYGQYMVEHHRPPVVKRRLPGKRCSVCGAPAVKGSKYCYDCKLKATLRNTAYYKRMKKMDGALKGGEG